MGILQNVLEFRAQEQAKARADIEAIAPAINQFIQNRRQSMLDQFNMDKASALLDIEKQKANDASVLQQFNIGQKQAETDANNAKASLLDGFINNRIGENDVLSNMTRFKITPEEFDAAASARDRLLSGGADAVPAGYEATGMTRDKFGNIVPSDIKKVAQPTAMDALQLEKAQLDIQKTKQDMEPVPLSETERLQQEQMKLGMNKTRQDMAINAQNQTFRFKKPIEQQKFEAEQADKAQKDASAADLARANAESALSSINEIRNNMGYFGRLDANLPATPGTEKVAWAKNVDRIKAMLTLDKLMELKNASKNSSSGLGALSDGERQMLNDAATALDKGLPKEKAAKYLNDIEKTLTKVLGGKMSGETKTIAGRTYERQSDGKWHLK